MDMDPRAVDGREQHLSVSQFAVREGVSRARILQLLGQDRISGAHKIGHHWTIPASSTLVRRKAGRPRAASGVPVDRLMRRLARKYVWWLPPAKALARPQLVATQVMEMGDYEDVCALEGALGREFLRTALRRAEPGRFSAASWAYWHYRLGLARPGRVPPLPRRTIR